MPREENSHPLPEGEGIAWVLQVIDGPSSPKMQRAALWPGMPLTAPPRVAEEPHR